ncbi:MULTISPECIES: flagellar biosynthesis protein FlhB [Helicobacter]|uniref:Flagellar biosynthetic protein FlhB n=1 Tax=Helicobacter typhlonius TaxID=76936 RepID=A0A099UGY6_9HELI|nr:MULTISPECIES: flagellar biosynthesis protein FlhB [Helicobacter]TLD78977.1 flagellar biosynthesis protein FlhB [Helicobacter typhlonius]TLD90310.1 flagellar biosynthesis protein FlhB [Helicobacter sp. MIT 03-1616]CUU38892.1 Flagellar biosynthesis protein FlhB [Helicobacter typhlonius]
MADDEEKTQAPSAHKIQKAREEGNVGKSPEFAGFFILLVGLGLMFLLIPFWVSSAEKIFLHISALMNLDVDSRILGNLMLGIILEVFIMLAPLFIALMATGVIANIAQFGFLLSPKAIKPKLSKINPISGFKNVISLKKLLDGFMITFKVFVAFIIGFAVFVSFFDELPSVSMGGLYAQILWFREKALMLIGVLLVLFFIMAVSDYLIKKYQYTKSLKMSIKEVKDEYKQYEQSPEIKAKIRRMQQKLAQSRMMQEIPSASVVITNPTHYAVALRYTQKEYERKMAPVVVAKGIDELAIRIKAVAREYGIRIVENPPLARAIYKQLDLNQTIPPELFGAVVQVLGEVARLDALEGKDSLSKLINTINSKSAQST